MYVGKLEIANVIRHEMDKFGNRELSVSQKLGGLQYMYTHFLVDYMYSNHTETDNVTLNLPCTETTLHCFFGRVLLPQSP